MIRTFYIIAVMFFVIFLLDVVAIAVTAIKFNENDRNHNVLVVFRLKASLNAFISALWLVVTLAIQFGW